MQKPRYLRVLLILPFAIGLMGLLWISASHIALPVGQTREGPVIGDLGGVPVEIPRVYARFVEYDGDPHFMERREKAPTKRTYKSRLRSFGFEVRFPDMASVVKKTPLGKDINASMWLRVGVSAGENYGARGDVALNNHKKNFLSRYQTCLPSKCFFYVRMPGNVYGLAGYTPEGSGIDIRRRDMQSNLGVDYRDKNIYVYEQDENITTFIRCSNATHKTAPCQQYFNLGSQMKAHVSVSYRKGLLPHWQKIQEKVSDLIYDFEVQGS